ncbi:YwiC-like family protein [Paenibacillus albidus]|uniref:YwiC-like family protein n=1 Tax=Paenibacillus albidus TaxID=2041023 RepID=UPI001BE6E339|nr:YwiC-like family protein [Paenibacillus albidus]MBT2289330.1 YwiC-like family protein [Paenibacillus albidus]
MKRYIPNQHGAWAMLILPFLFGVAASGGHYLHIPLFVCWLLIYLFSFPLLQWVKTRRSDRYGKPVLVYGALLVPFILYMIISVPNLFWFALPLIPLFAVNVYFAKTKNERALLNDISAILAFCLMVYPVFYVGEGESWEMATNLFVLSVLYFIGTALYVKTIIRERKNPYYYYASVIYHIIMVVLGLLFWPAVAAAPLVVLLLRAIILPKTGVTAKQTGISEIGFSAMLYLVVIFCM